MIKELKTYMFDKELSIRKLSVEVGVSTSQLTRIFAKGVASQRLTYKINKFLGLPQDKINTKKHVKIRPTLTYKKEKSD